ncbi:MAG TPA: FAD-dependent oxidoreductase [Baekduia sp.]|nr:FAD-dependent oxidoreductase [Baekduia sp.]
MRHSIVGHWMEALPPAPPSPPLEGDATADVVVVGGGYLGLWTAHQLATRDASLRVVLLEAETCGHGPSGRNGGFANHYWDQLPSMVALFGRDEAIRLARASADALQQLGAWCGEHAPEAEFTWTPQVEVATGPLQEGEWQESVDAVAAAGRGDDYRALSRDDVQRICRTPAFGGGAVEREAATVQPAGLVHALRRRVLELGVALHEHSRVLALDDGDAGVVVTTPGGRVRARRAVLAMNWRTATVKPLRSKLTVASSHVVATRPMAETLAKLGWAGHSLCDLRAMLHYTRLTSDNRIVFGWGGGQPAMGGRQPRHLFHDPAVQRHTAAALCRFFPGVTEADVEVGWGGPIDVSADHLPHYGQLRSTVYGFGFTGNGVAPSRLGGDILAAMALDARSDVTRLPLVGRNRPGFPPALPTYVGGSLLRDLMVAMDDRDERGAPVPGPLRLAVGVPRRLGFHVPR